MLRLKASSLCRWQGLVLLVCLIVPASHAQASLELCRGAISDNQPLRAYDYCLPLAQLGDADAAFLIAGLYAMGLALPGETGQPDLAEAVRWLKTASANGHGEATYNLGVAYHHGKGVDADLPAAIRTYRRAAELGNPKAMRNLATFYETGNGLKQDLPVAFELYERSAQTGLADSQLKTALMLLSGEGVVADPIKARFWLNLSAGNGNSTAQFTLGALLEETEPHTSIHWYREAVKQNNGFAAHNLALVYYRSSYFNDLMLALAYADRGVELGNDKSQALYRLILQAMKSPEWSAPVVRSKVVGVQDRHWLNQQPPQRFVVQLARLNTARSVQHFLREHQLQRLAHSIVLNPSGSDFVVLLNQDFANRADAQQQLLAALPEALQKEAWIRNYRSLQTR